MRLLDRRGVRFPTPQPLIDGTVPRHDAVHEEEGHIVWALADGGRILLDVKAEDGATRIDLRVENVGRPLASLGLRFEGITGVRRYLRNGYQSWDGSWFVEPGTPAGDGPPAKAPTLGFAMTALLPEANLGGAVLLGADRHDRFQIRFRFGGNAESMRMDVETLLDRTGETQAETLCLFEGDAVEETLRLWSRRVAAASPLPPRKPARLTGWCSWYNLYAAIDEDVIREHLLAAQAFRERNAVRLDIFQIDDGFTPEMGDWLSVKPQFPGGMKPLLAKISAAGFRPGLWIAPFLVGNRSRLFAEHPDWVVQDRTTGSPLVAMHFYGEFRWHKRSEEYHVLDITHPDAAAYMTRVFRTWAEDWGAGYIKADFLLHGAEYGPERALWHEPGLSRIAVWRRMMLLIREAIGPDVILSGCGCPLWAGVGLVDAVRIGRDIGVTWNGDYSAESLLRDLQSRNHANGILWQADPDCILLRDRFHALSDDQINLLARFAAGAGGVTMTSDHLGELRPDREALFATLLGSSVIGCDFPELGSETLQIDQQLRTEHGPGAFQRFRLGADARMVG
ncbi:glycoside hydrolase family 36 protein [Sphingosinicella sp. BN140058]|uniref:glycoside hydrolase family 36 protein n=1 Tax=Sphingosinicella sp. BN140058 TaxID=1892855 RepID=UPI001011CA2A|nr:glycoside hydrolase family 36 protein [Sphingosinicella sp. BN140058]QAY77152.1 alpha-galactosidase [Sphingosinicella sp. BN140058]